MRSEIARSDLFYEVRGRWAGRGSGDAYLIDNKDFDKVCCEVAGADAGERNSRASHTAGGPRYELELNE